jgi:hypothetical protein
VLRLAAALLCLLLDAVSLILGLDQDVCNWGSIQIAQAANYQSSLRNVRIALVPPEENDARRVELTLERTAPSATVLPVQNDQILEESQATEPASQCEEPVLPQRVEVACPQSGQQVNHFQAMMERARAAELVGNGQYYGVAFGRKIGVYSLWALAQAQVFKISGGCQKSFSSVELALQFVMEYSIYLGTEGDIPQFNNDDVEIACWRYISDPVEGNRHWELVSDRS